MTGTAFTRGYGLLYIFIQDMPSLRSGSLIMLMAAVVRLLQFQGVRRTPTLNLHRCYLVDNTEELV
jgi:hypothetical protein